ncbi:MAG: RepB family plasmid replication initiator protein [Candidatus Kapaibacterium sp.]|nr:MAG: RepB family plasmid replication initiator protein [Candidatus Kapabacteria bacterium]
MEEFPLTVEEFPPTVEVFPLALANPPIFSKKAVLKASATIAISGELSLAERRVYNLLYAHAYDRMSQEKVHTVFLPELFASLDKTLHRYDEMKAVIEKLVSTNVKYNILGKDQRRGIWGVAALLAGATIDETTGKLTYEFPEHIKPFLNAPPYGKINLKQQNKLNSTHSLSLYELFCDYFDARRGFGETGWIFLAQYQELLGTSYKEWRDIQKHLIKVPLEKINKTQKEFVVTYRIRKAGRRVVAVKFVIAAQEKEAESPETPRTFAHLTFAKLAVHQKYRIIGGTEDVFVKISESEAYNVRTRKTITILNMAVGVERFR